MKHVHQHEHVKSELENIRVDKTRGMMIRTKAQWLKEGEKNTKFVYYSNFPYYGQWPPCPVVK
jgi:hypothetical protein